MALKKKRREKKEALDIDITSLLDILVILLVFLLKSYNATDLQLEVAKGIELANSKSKLLGSHAVIIQISKEKEIWIDSKKIGRASFSGDRITNLYTALDERKKKEITRLPASEKGKDGKKKDEQRRINIVIDQDLPYSVVKKVMHTAALAGYSKFKFIVQGDYQ